MILNLLEWKYWRKMEILSQFLLRARLQNIVFVFLAIVTFVSAFNTSDVTPSSFPTNIPSMLPSGQPSSQPTVSSKSILAYWPFLGNTLDASPNQRNCVNHGAKLVTGVTNTPDSAYLFTRLAKNFMDCDFLDVPIDKMRTVSGAMYFRSITGSQEIWSRSISGLGIELLIFGRKLCTFCMGASESVNLCTPVALRTWYHVTVTHDGSKLQLFLNGHLNQSIAYNFPISPANRLFLGNWNQTNGVRFFNGSIDHLVVLDFPVSSTQAYFLYTQTMNRKLSYEEMSDVILTTPTSQPTAQPSTRISTFLKSGLVAYYPFDGNANDNSGNDNDGVLHGNIELTTDRFGNGRSAYMFDGSSSYIEVEGTHFNFVSDFAISLWIYAFPNQNPYATILDKSFWSDSAVTGIAGFTLQFFRHTKELVLDLIPYNPLALPFLATIGTDEWNHLIITKQDGRLLFYQNAVLVFNQTMSGQILENGNNSLIIGGANSEPIYPATYVESIFNGSIDELFFFNRSLSLSEVIALFEFGTPTSAPSTQPSTQPTSFPTSFPSIVSTIPTNQPLSVPTVRPSSQPTSFPSAQPTIVPSRTPTFQPISKPSSQPSTQPSGKPTRHPSFCPSSQPSIQPTSTPTTWPSSQPSTRPSNLPISSPSSHPTIQPTGSPTVCPSINPSAQPSLRPTEQPLSKPSSVPSISPTVQPSGFPSYSPTSEPTSSPSGQTSCLPSDRPSCQPTSHPTSRPSSLPSDYSTGQPSSKPSVLPFYKPLGCPPTSNPSTQPSMHPSSLPSLAPSSRPSITPSSQPSQYPSSIPSYIPTNCPTQFPTSLPSNLPSLQPVSRPSSVPSLQSWNCRTRLPSSFRSASPSFPHSFAPSCSPSFIPTFTPPSVTPQPSRKPTVTPFPTVRPTGTPFLRPSLSPAMTPLPLLTINPFTSHFKESLFLVGSTKVSTPSDVLINLAAPYIGETFVIFGRSNLPLNIDLTNPSNLNLAIELTRNEGGLKLDEEERIVTKIGDLDGDGNIDYFVAYPSSSTAFVYLRTVETNNLSNLAASFSIRLNYSSANSYLSELLGWSAASLGDINHDGFEDFMLSALLQNAVYIIYGRRFFVHPFLLANIREGIDGFRINGKETDIDFGMCISSAGDFNGDGYTDFLISAMLNSNNAQGVVYIILGDGKASGSDINLNTLTNSSYFRIISPIRSFAGMSVSGLGDFNGDGYDDIVIGSIPYRGGFVSQQSFVVLGRPGRGQTITLTDMKQGVGGFTITGGGFMVTGIDDINQDGFSDLMVVNYQDWIGNGNAYILVYPSNVTSFPTLKPSFLPSSSPTSSPTSIPTSSQPSHSPVSLHSHSPNSIPVTRSPTVTKAPRSSRPTSYPPSFRPTPIITVSPTPKPSISPSYLVTHPPVPTSFAPTVLPSIFQTPPTRRPSPRFSSFPTSSPSFGLTSEPYQTIRINRTGPYFEASDNHSATWFIIDISSKENVNSGSALNLQISGGGSRRTFTIYPFYPTSTQLRSKQTLLIVINDFNRNQDILDLTHFLNIHSINDISFSTNPLQFILTDYQTIRLLSLNSLEELSKKNIYFSLETSPSSSSSKGLSDDAAVWSSTSVTASLGLLFLGFLFISCILYVSPTSKSLQKDEIAIDKQWPSMPMSHDDNLVDTAGDENNVTDRDSQKIQPDNSKIPHHSLSSIKEYAPPSFHSSSHSSSVSPSELDSSSYSFASLHSRNSSASFASFSLSPPPMLPRSDHLSSSSNYSSSAPPVAPIPSSPSSSFASFRSLHLSARSIGQSRDYADDSAEDDEKEEEEEERSSSSSSSSSSSFASNTRTSSHQNH